MSSLQPSGPDTPMIDLSHCDREAIHLIGHVQSYGCLISTSFDLMVNHMSLNCGDLIGIDPEDAVGQRLMDLLPGHAIHELRAKLQISSSTGQPSRIFGYDLLGDGKLFDISVHGAGKSFVFEFEPKSAVGRRDDLGLVQPLIARVKQRPTMIEVTQEAAKALQGLTGFDRVMVYRFAPDGSGEVIAERCARDMEPFLGLHYPASDIPKQARELYKRNPLRLIADVNDPTSPIVPEKNPNGDPLDLTMATTRAVSPIHIQYLRNMGVGASMSVSILKDGELWGMFACHHRSAHYIDYERRSAIELFAQFFSYELERKIEAEVREDERRSRDLHDRLMIRLSAGDDLIGSVDIIAEELTNLIPNDGVAVFSEGRLRAKGQVPDDAQFRRMTRFLNSAPTGQVYATDRLMMHYPAAEEFGDRIAGLIAVPISRLPRDYIVFFRQEIARAVQWAGNPDKAAHVEPGSVRLSPRKSFEAWTEMVRHTCRPWSEGELRTAEALRISLIEIVLKLSDEANAERKSAAEKQELLIAELNHRVRNILNLIQGLVSQSKAGNTTVASYTQVLDGRVQALARAHDQLTRQEWNPTGIRELIEVEASAYLNGQRDRLRMTGDAPMLAPQAFSAMALLVHELVTNSAKYGALTDSSGTVTVDLRITQDGALQIEWRERGGPPVQAPTRRGFGTTIIERTVPHELKGSVQTRYKLAGFEADITVPSVFVHAGELPQPKSQETADPMAVVEIAPLTGIFMVLEDNMIISLDASDILMTEGADDVKLASDVETALEIVETTQLTCAVLDVNLGDQTSLPVAERLAALGVPFVLATGYGDVDSILGEYPPAPVLKKPYTSESLPKLIRDALVD